MMSEILKIGYWGFIIISIFIGVYLFCNVLDRDTIESPNNKTGIEFTYILLGIPETVFAITCKNTLYPLIIGIIYWIVYIVVFTYLGKYISIGKKDGYNIIKKGHFQYNQKVYELDRICPKCSFKSKELKKLVCGHKSHYLFECKECGTSWTGHFFK